MMKQFYSLASVFVMTVIIGFAVTFVFIKLKARKRTRYNHGFADDGIKPVKPDSSILKRSRHDHSADRFK